MREPAIFWWPGKLKTGTVMEMGTTMDLLPTFCSLSNTKLPDDRVYDGYDISPLLFGTGKSDRDEVFYYRGRQVYAVRKGDYKAHFITQLEYGSRTAHSYTDPKVEINETPTIQDTPLLYNLSTDPSEKYNIAAEHPDLIAEIKKVLEAHQKSVVPVENQLEK
jgi:arylsulfatase A-like enzyme